MTETSPAPDTPNTATPAWQSLHLPLPPALRDPMGGLLLGVGAEGTWDDGDELIAYFPAATVRTEIDHAVRAWLHHLGTPAIPLTWRWQADADWVTAWQDQFEPMPVGDTLIVLPAWVTDNPEPHRTPIHIRPGQGFGTGGHDTTHACLECLEEALTAHREPGHPMRVLDVGTGSGILALGAARLGADVVIALDNDADAVENARDNRALNDLSRVHLVTGTLATVATPATGGTYDIILANLLAHTLVELMPELAAHRAPGGCLILSGILNEQGDRVEVAVRDAGLIPTDYRSRGMWLTLVVHAPATDP